MKTKVNIQKLDKRYMENFNKLLSPKEKKISEVNGGVNDQK